MSTMETRFIEPLDVLFLRGNKLFGDPGSHGESLVPPWPSMAAGALRSRLLADDGIDFPVFALGDIPHPTLGTPSRPGSFAVTRFDLARRFADGRVEALIAPPADLVISRPDRGQAVVIRRLRPTVAAAGLLSSGQLPFLPVLAEAERGKPVGGYWLTEAGWKRYLAGETPTADDVLKSAVLWGIDHRVGIGLDTAARRAADGKLFSMQAVAMRKREHTAAGGFDVGFLVGVSGATLPGAGMLRLGGDGRAAALHTVENIPPEADYNAITGAGRCRIVLTTPGLFPEGWRLPGVDKEGSLTFRGVRARLVCAAVPRAETVSGWDLARRHPKPAERMAPAGSVYWLDELEATPDALGKLVAAGLWGEPCEDAGRRAEGFNRIAIAAY